MIHTMVNQGMRRKLWQMPKKAVKSSVGIFNTNKVWTCLNKVSKIGILGILLFEMTDFPPKNEIKLNSLINFTI